MTTNARIRAVAFDVFGTLLDVYSIGATIDRHFPGKGAQLAELWRRKQIEYTWLRSLGQRYKPFWQLTCDALDHAAEALDIEMPETVRIMLINNYTHLAPFPENAAALRELKKTGIPLAVLSNGDPQLLAACLANAMLEKTFDHVLSVDPLQRYKPDPAVYALGTEAFGLPAEEILFVSSNGWDIAGAGWFGYTTFWLNRGKQTPEGLDIDPVFTGTKLTDIIGLTSPNPNLEK